MKTYLTAGFVVVVTLLGPVAAAEPFRFTPDYYFEGGYYYGDGTPSPFEIWEVGSRVESGRLEFSILTDTPEQGLPGSDSYAEDVVLSPGDLWITVGTTNPFTTCWPRHAIALTTHANVVPQAYPGQGWPTVTKGRLYKDAEFATGTFETYQEYMVSSGFWYTPDDQDGDDTQNSYLSLIRGFGAEVTGHSDVSWTYEPYWYWDYDVDDWRLADSWRVTGWVDLDQIGLTADTPYSLFVSCECGNDGALHAVIPEPATAGLLLLGLVAAGRRRR